MAGRLQNEDIKSLADITLAGGAKSQLPNDSKLFISAYNRDKTLDEVLLQKLLGGSPLKIHQNLTADSKLYIDAGNIDTLEGTGQTLPPINNQIPTVVASTIDFQTAATTGATFIITFPASTVGQFRRLGLTLLSTGTISCLFSPEAASVGALANPGTVFISGGLPIGYIDLECTQASPGRFKTAGSATNIIENKVSGTHRIFAFGSGGGAGGAGDGNELLERMKESFEDSLFGFMTPTIIKTDGVTLVDEANSTGSLDFTDNTYQIDSGEIVRTVQFLDPDFLNDERDLAVADLTVYWKLANLDPSAVYQLSRDGGVTFQTVSMSRISETDAVTGRLTFAADPNAILSTYAVANADNTSELTDTSNNQELAIPIVTTVANVFRKLTVYLNKTGSALGTVTLSLVRNNAGQPSTTLTDVTVYSAAYDISTLSAGNNTLALDISDTPLAAGTYYLKLTTDSTYKAAFVTGVTSLQLRVDASSPSGEILRQYNGTVWANVSSVGGCYIAEGRPLDLRVKITSALAGAKVSGIVVQYDLSGSVVSGIIEQNTKIVAPGENTSTFALSFLPNPRFLKVYWVETQKTFVHPAFDINGQNVIFAPGTFNDSLNQITLVFDQSQGAGFDTSDANAAGIASNSAQLTALGEQLDTLKLVYLPKISVPSTTIVNRAQIPDLANDLCVRFGDSRIVTQSIYQLQNEVGPSGERVWGALNDDLGLVRFVGSWSTLNNSQGQTVRDSLTTDYVEVTFYGTGLNLLWLAADSGISVSTTIDGGSETATVSGATYSSVLSGRNYSSNQQLQVASGLSLGIHTVKIRATTAGSLRIYGFEVINVSSTLVVNPGSYYVNAKKLTLASQQSPAYNSTFESGTLSTRGGRVITYLKSDGTVAKALTPTNAAIAYETSADHTSEELARIYHPREFGAGRTDDWSRLGGSTGTFAFTLEDGTTTLTGGNTNAGISPGTEGAYTYNASVKLVFTFVGTGLDLQVADDAGSPVNTYTYYVDGNTPVSWPYTRSTTPKIVKIASGLPYGTHTFTLNCTGWTSGGVLTVQKFITYQPKKPTIPSGAVELADYNIMADYSNNTAGDELQISNGILVKSGVREISYTGTWTADTVNPSWLTGFNTKTATNADYMEYTFFGTGIEHRTWFGSTSTYNLTYLIDGIALNTGANTGSTVSVHSGQLGSIVISAAGVLTGTSAAGSGYGSKVRISGLPLGAHKLRVTRNTITGGDTNMYTSGVNIITPIHSPKSNLIGDIQNTLPVGSCSLSDSRKFSIKESVQKYRGSAFGVVSGPTFSSTTPTAIPDMSLTVVSPGAWFRMSSNIVVQAPSTSVAFWYYFFVDGVSYGKPLLSNYLSSNQEVTLSMNGLVYLSPGIHRIENYGAQSVASGSTTYTSTLRSLFVEEE